MKSRMIWKRNSLLTRTVLVCLLLVTAARCALALWLLSPVTANGIYDEHTFTITTRKVESFEELQITIAPHPKAISPFLTGQLNLVTDDKLAAVVPVAEKRDNDTVVYTFRVAPGSLAQSTFEIHASFYAPISGKKGNGLGFRVAKMGKQTVEQIMGGTIYQIKLKDFVSKPTAE